MLRLSERLSYIDDCAKMRKKELFFEYPNGACTNYVGNKTQKNNFILLSSCNCQHTLNLVIYPSLNSGYYRTKVCQSSSIKIGPTIYIPFVLKLRIFTMRSN